MARGRPKLSEKLLKESIALLKKHGTIYKAMHHATRQDGIKGVDHQTFRRRLKLAGYVDEKSDEEVSQLIQKRIRREPTSVGTLALTLNTSQKRIKDTVKKLRSEGYNIHDIDNVLSLQKQSSPGSPHADDLPTYMSRPDDTFLFGAMGDTHIASKYARYDVMNDLYDKFEEAGADRVFHTGNYIDGEFRFNAYDLEKRGLHAQTALLAERYPMREGITTYAVSGDDHEGWYAQREGLDVGFYTKRVMEEHGRSDWVDLGYMEAFIRLINSNTGKETIMTVCHPGGGSSYALSYSIQKIIESLDGGEKPAVGLYGHYHKMWAGNIRNVWCIQTGCCEDQTPFMRKKKLEAHVGGLLVGLRQDPQTGAIVGCTPEMFRYFNKGYYNNRWNPARDVTQGGRTGL